MITRNTYKRDMIAKDVRTGQIVKVTEQGRGDDYMVKTMYKSDGYWTGGEHLVPTTDPHVWGGRQFIAFLISLAVGAWVSYGIFDAQTGHGFGGADALLTAVPSGVLTVLLVQIITGITRF